MPRINSEPTHAKDVKPYTFPLKNHTVSSTSQHTNPSEVEEERVEEEDLSVVVKKESQEKKGGRVKMEKKSRNKGNGRNGKEGNVRTSKAWMGEEKVRMFELVMKHGLSIKTFEGQFEGRTAKQCYDSWSHTMAPTIKRCLSGNTK
ncbi:hypothetical protein M231_05540 [Tremella mesenterica]|uniref:Myb-like domain-containing protein n=1 Tax=Tremella mesenterica TaxID=5217 RepID=A0A4Q1BHS6_TREME|nr:hypothetical protein M231_05540 [Tremella mesenterica]